MKARLLFVLSVIRYIWRYIEIYSAKLWIMRLALLVIYSVNNRPCLVIDMR